MGYDTTPTKLVKVVTNGTKRSYLFVHIFNRSVMTKWVCIFKIVTTSVCIS